MNFSVKSKQAVVAVIIAVVLIGAVVYKWGYVSWWSVRPDADRYQAVFVSNGQVYFGKLTINRRNYVLRDVYYIKTNTPIKEGEQPADTQLVKMGDEIHAPEDMMVLERNNVLFWENIRTNGRVADGIVKHKAQASAASQTINVAPSQIEVGGTASSANGDTQ